MDNKLKYTVFTAGAVMLVALAVLITIFAMQPKAGTVNTPSAPVATTLQPPPQDNAGIPSGYELQIKQDGGITYYSTDGGKTWSRELPNNADMSVNVEIIEQ
ncbi:MAG: hypothetical protein LBN02_09370 [Oscillospiraceae bacterium]|nr:hypothetical protein [Oscillospiraceae bacterium]